MLITLRMPPDPPCLGINGDNRWLHETGDKYLDARRAVSHTYTATGPANAQVRIISAREATRAERRQYEDEPR